MYNVNMPYFLITVLLGLALLKTELFVGKYSSVSYSSILSLVFHRWSRTDNNFYCEKITWTKRFIEKNMIAENGQFPFSKLQHGVISVLHNLFQLSIK